MERRHIVVQLQSEAQLIHLLRFDKARLDGRTIRIHRAEYNMTGEEMMALVRKEFQVEEDKRLLCQFYGCEEVTGQEYPSQHRNEGGVFQVGQAGNPRPAAKPFPPRGKGKGARPGAKAAPARRE